MLGSSDESKSLASQNSILRQEARHLEDRNAALESEKSALEDRLRELQLGKDKLHEALRAQQQRTERSGLIQMDHLEKNNRELQDQCKELQGSLARLRQQQGTGSMASAEKVERLEAALDRKTQLAETNLETMRAKLGECRRQVHRLQSENNVLREELHPLRTRFEVVQAQNTCLAERAKASEATAMAVAERFSPHRPSTNSTPSSPNRGLSPSRVPAKRPLATPQPRKWISSKNTTPPPAEAAASSPSM